MLLPIVSILLLITSTLMWVAMNSSVLSYQSTVVSHNVSQQFLLAEYTLLQAETWLQQTPSSQLPLPVATCGLSPCILQTQTAAYLPTQSASWWQALDNPTVTAVSMDIPQTHAAFYAVEQFMELSSADTSYFRVTSWALLKTQVTPTVLQSVWVKSEVVSENRRQAWREWN